MPSLTLVELAAGAASPVMRAVAQAPDGSVFVGVEQASVGLPVLYVVSGGALAPVTLPDSGDLLSVPDFAVGPTALYALAQRRVYVYQEVDSSWGWSVFAQVPEYGTTLAWHEGSLYLGAESGLYQYQRLQWILVQEWVGAPSRLREYNGVLVTDGYAVETLGQPQTLGTGASWANPNSAVWFLGAAYGLVTTGGSQAPSLQSLVRTGPSRPVETVATWQVSKSGFYWFVGVYQGSLVLCGGLPTTITPLADGVSSLVMVTGCFAYYNGAQLLLAQPGPLVACLREGAQVVALGNPGPVGVGVNFYGFPEEALHSATPYPSGEDAISWAENQMGSWGWNTESGIYWGGAQAVLPPTTIYGQVMGPAVGAFTLVASVAGGAASPTVGGFSLSAGIASRPVSVGGFTLAAGTSDGDARPTVGSFTLVAGRLPYPTPVFPAVGGFTLCAGTSDGTARPTVGAFALVASATGGAARPTVGGFALAASVQLDTAWPLVGAFRLTAGTGAPGFPTVGAFTLCAGTSDGSARPTVGAFALAASVRGGSARPTVGGFSLVVGQLPWPFPGYTPTVGSFTLTAGTGTPAPAEGESVLILNYTLDVSPAQVRIVTDRPLADEAGFTVLVRLADSVIDPTDYSTYQVAACNEDITLTQSGVLGTIAIFGTGTRPSVFAQWN